MFWYHRSAPAPSGSTGGQALLGLLTLQPRLCPNPWANPYQTLWQSLNLPAKSLNLEREAGAGNASSQWAPLHWGYLCPVTAGWGQFVGTAAALFSGGNREVSLAFFAFFFLFFFLVPSDACSPLSLANSFSCFLTVALLVVMAAAKSMLASFLAFFFDFFFFFSASFSTLTGLWMADSWRMSEADTAASRHRCHSSSLSSLLQREGSLGQLESGQAPKLPLTASVYATRKRLQEEAGRELRLGREADLGSNVGFSAS